MVVELVLVSSFLVGSPQIAREAAAATLLTVSMILVEGLFGLCLVGRKQMGIKVVGWKFGVCLRSLNG